MISMRKTARALVEAVSATLRHACILGGGALFVGALAASPLCAAPVKTAHLELELVAEGTATPGGTVHVALRQTILPGWHTYWRNPGDAGEATQIDWTLPKGWSSGAIVWPTPERAVTGPLMNYVYSNAVILPVPIRVADDASPGGTAVLTAHASLLVCKDVCVPEEATLTLNLPVAAKASPDPVWGRKIAEVLSAAPKPAKAKAVFAAKGDVVSLAISGPAAGAAIKAAGLADAYFYPFAGTVIDHAKPQKVSASADGLILSLPAGYDFSHGKPPARLAGIISFGKGRAFEIDATPGALPAAALAPADAAAPVADAVAPPQSSAPITAPVAPAVAAGKAGPVNPDGLNLPVAMLLAVLGGLILNLMPCVFPVLSIKAAALARHTEHPAAARMEGIAYLVGVVASFMGLAMALILARGAGEAVGWGFQLQSPGTVAALTLVMLASALNLSGVFEMGLSAQGAGQGLTTRGGFTGAFFTGVLAVVVAAPCTGPFMASTIGWALAQPTVTALAVFASLGLGLALPFLALAFLPGLYRVMPKPGAWMDGLRKFLAFPMYGAAAWLAWVFAEEAGSTLLPYLFAAALSLAFGLWLWGVGQRSATDRGRLGSHVAAVVAAAVAVAVLVFAPHPNPARAGVAPIAADGAIQPWSPARVAELQAKGQPVFVDFTAAWCVTCKVNEAGALASPGVAQAFKKTGTVYLRADWTNRNAEIANTLQAQGRAGVPLYLVYSRKGGAPVVLPQLLTESDVVNALTAAAR